MAQKRPAAPAPTMTHIVSGGCLHGSSMVFHRVVGCGEPRMHPGLLGLGSVFRARPLVGPYEDSDFIWASPSSAESCTYGFPTHFAVGKRTQGLRKNHSAQTPGTRVPQISLVFARCGSAQRFVPPFSRKWCDVDCRTSTARSHISRKTCETWGTHALGFAQSFSAPA